MNDGAGGFFFPLRFSTGVSTSFKSPGQMPQKCSISNRDVPLLAVMVSLMVTFCLYHTRPLKYGGSDGATLLGSRL